MSGKEPSTLQNEENRILREIVGISVGYSHVFVGANRANERLSHSASAACSTTQRLANSLHRLKTRSHDLEKYGQQWRQRRFLATSAASNYQRIVELCDAPQTFEVCLRNDMFLEANMVLEHVGALHQQHPGSQVISDVHDALQGILAQTLPSLILPSLCGPLTLSAAVKTLGFLRNLGVVEADLRALFLHHRREYFLSLVRDCEKTTVGGYSLLSKVLTTFKIHVADSVTQYEVAFVDEVHQKAMASQLSYWTTEHSNWLVMYFSKSLKGMMHGAELATLSELVSQSSVSLNKVAMDAGFLLQALLSQRVQEIFFAQLRSCEVSYQAAMSTHSWKKSALHSASATRSTSDAAPVHLLNFIPLAFAINGILSSFNEIRKCVSLCHSSSACFEATRTLVHKIRNDIQRVLLTASSESELEAVSEFESAFTADFVPHLDRCLRQVFPDAVVCVESLASSLTPT